MFRKVVLLPSSGTQPKQFVTSDKLIWILVQLGDDELASGDWREGEVLFPL
jgi:hypothetical protein